jgi:hypothetical protein
MPKKRTYTEYEMSLIAAWVAGFGSDAIATDQDLFKLLGGLQDFEFFEDVREHATRKR